jgi:hypothetical protein
VVVLFGGLGDCGGCTGGGSGDGRFSVVSKNGRKN